MNTDTILSLVPSGTSVPTVLLALIALLATVALVVGLGMIFVRVAALMTFRKPEPMQVTHFIRGAQ